MDHQERHQQEKKTERERENAQQKHHDKEAESREKKGWLRAPRPFGLIVVGIVLTLFIVLTWMFYFRP